LSIIKNYEVIRQSKRRRVILDVVSEFLHEIRADVIVDKRVCVNGEYLVVGESRFLLDDEVYLFGFGKAAGELALGLSKKLGSRLRGGMINTDHYLEINKLRINLCTHPFPDEQTVEHSKELVSYLNSLDKNTTVIFLITGGASSLFEIPSIPLSEYRKKIDALMRSGADIAMLNKFRSKVSLVKGGKLVSTLTANWLSLILSDVIGPPWLVGSGPTFTSMHKDKNIVLADNCYARKMFREVALRHGIMLEVQKKAVVGDVMQAAKHIARSCSKTVFGGETTVSTGLNAGLGGRNQELALLLSRTIAGTSHLFLALGTDGKDGNSNAAGALVDGRSADVIGEELLNDSLRRHNSTVALEKSKDLIITGPTGTNLADIYVCW